MARSFPQSSADCVCRHLTFDPSGAFNVTAGGPSCAARMDPAPPFNQIGANFAHAGKPSQGDRGRTNGKHVTSLTTVSPM